MSNFSNILKNILEEFDLSQKQLADAAQTTEATISRYINFSNRTPNAEILVNISRALNVSTDYLLGLSDVPRQKADITAEERILLSAFRKATERDIAIIWQVLESYLSSNEKESLQQSEKTDNQKIG